MLFVALVAIAGATTVVAQSTVACKMTVAKFNDNSTCEDFANQYNLNLSQFEAINPNVTTCPDLPTGDYCIVGTADATYIAPKQSTNTTFISYVSGAAASIANYTLPHAVTSDSTTPTPTSGIYPTFTGMPSDCSAYHLVAADDTCSWVAMKYGISLQQFYAWNPSIDYGCGNLYLGYYVCVDVPGAVHTSTYNAATKPGSQRPTETRSV
ncbi:peptidoglycan-binding protein [Grosmannia clavigera kw1407]|uniref:Peptidoglycan-binding protein n=1 Tax=Grosmannia clavigera (strain kw1407 / UAMH 11150) TaxID=655863 RepID=F0XU63_GROCL|nr:peptidoglycan-binding protein [Grosmannia clavigera kw1407]EFW98917.1 peptidoglycan-binding protein [Grosmannia clavigera kw1407]